jgi:hypothetical protein
MRAAPLPNGMHLLLRVAAGDRSSINEAMQFTGRPETVLRQAVEFFIEQVLLSPESESYRVLGANSDSSNAELRRNMALLLRWMHPDVAENASRSMFAGRVTMAWDDLKTLERRVAYDVTRCRATSGNAKPNAKKAGANTKSRTKSQNGSTGSRKSAQSRSVAIYSARQPGLLRRAWLLLLGRS